MQQSANSKQLPENHLYVLVQGCSRCWLETLFVTCARRLVIDSIGGDCGYGSALYSWDLTCLRCALQIIGTSAIRISWGKNSMSRMQGGAPYPGFGSHPSATAPTALPGDLSFPYYQPLPGAAAPSVDPYAAYAFALQQQASSASSPLLQVVTQGDKWKLQCQDSAISLLEKFNQMATQHLRSGISGLHAPRPGCHVAWPVLLGRYIDYCSTTYNPRKTSGTTYLTKHPPKLWIQICLQALQEQHMKDLQLQMLQNAGRNNHPALAGPLAPLATQDPVRDYHYDTIHGF